MATMRPLMRLSIGDLEDIFEKQIKNLATMGRLKEELSHRQVPRALALLERVQQAEALLENADNHRPAPKFHGATLQLKPRTAHPAPVSPPSVKEADINPPLAGLGQPDLFMGTAPTQEPISPKAAATCTPALVSSLSRHKAAEPEALPQLSLEDACRILKVGVSDGWEKIETARRKIVLKSNPTATAALAQAQLQKLLAEAKLANDAAIVIAARRSGRQ
jgi:hypothetical protein